MFNNLSHQEDANQTKLPLDITSQLSEWLRSRTQETAGTYEDVEKEKHFSTACGIASWYNYFGNHSGYFSEHWA